MSDPVKWQIIDGKFWTGGVWMEGSCHHRKRGACGGCYMRLVWLLEELERGADPKLAVWEVFERMRLERAEREVA